jgi:hypothetical protein
MSWFYEYGSELYDSIQAGNFSNSRTKLPCIMKVVSYSDMHIGGLCVGLLLANFTYICLLLFPLSDSFVSLYSGGNDLHV